MYYRGGDWNKLVYPDLVKAHECMGRYWNRTFCLCFDQFAVDLEVLLP
jgi:hypothetical protein